jgi:hypothetical protein
LYDWQVVPVGLRGRLRSMSCWLEKERMEKISRPRKRRVVMMK